MALRKVEARIDRGPVGKGVNQSHRIECDDGRTYVVKPRHADRQFANELIAYAIGRLVGAPLPEAVLVTLSAEFLTSSATAAARYPNAGEYFGSQEDTLQFWTLDNPDPGLVHAEVRNVDEIYNLVIFDEIILNSDRAGNPGNHLLVRVSNESPKYEIRAIDHGHVLTGTGWTAAGLRSSPVAPTFPVLPFVAGCLTSKSDLMEAGNQAKDAKDGIPAAVMDSEAGLPGDDSSAVADVLQARAVAVPAWAENDYPARYPALK